MVLNNYQVLQKEVRKNRENTVYLYNDKNFCKMKEVSRESIRNKISRFRGIGGDGD